MRKSYLAHFRGNDHVEQSLVAHLRAVSEYAAIYASKVGLDRVGRLIGLLHDLGKYSLAFQNYLKSAEGLLDQDSDDYVDSDALRGKIDHSSAGAQFIWNRLSSQAGLDPLAAQVLALCIASHHSGLIDCVVGSGAEFGVDNFTRRMKKASEKTHFDEVVGAADPEILDGAAELLGDAGLIAEIRLRTGRIIAANKDSRAAMLQQLGLMVRFLFSCLIDADRTDTADFETGKLTAIRQVYGVGCFGRAVGNSCEWFLFADGD